VDDERAFLDLDRSRLEELTEAWIPVRSAYGPGVLVFANSDSCAGPGERQLCTGGNCGTSSIHRGLLHLAAATCYQLPPWEEATTLDVTDEQWRVLEPLVGPMPRRADGRGRPWRSSREAPNGIV
jgi:hypothetical protein